MGYLTLKRIICVYLPIHLFLVVSGGMSMRESHGIPAFSKKYRTECVTCHFHFPKLNSLGEAFRKLGYRFPDGPYEDKVDGHYAHDGGFASLPVSFDLTSQAEVERNEGVSFNDLGGDFLILSGGSINRMISFYGSVDFSVGGGGGDDIDVVIPRMHVMFRPFRTPLVNIKVGRFEPRVLGVSNFRTLTPAFGILNRRIGDNGWSLEPYQQGIELNGIFGRGRFAYSLGLVEGGGNGDNDFKDSYARLEYKWRGKRLDGTMDGGPFVGYIRNAWRDNSVTFGVFGYYGEADIDLTQDENGSFGVGSARSGIAEKNDLSRVLHTPGLDLDGGDGEGHGGVAVRDRFFKVGADINWLREKVNLVGGYALQRHSSPIASRPGQSITEHQAFIEIDYAHSHFFQPTIRYEIFLQEGRGSMLQKIQPQLNFHLGEAVHIFVSEDFVKDVGDSGFSAAVGIVGLDIVF